MRFPHYIQIMKIPVLITAAAIFSFACGSQANSDHSNAVDHNAMGHTNSNSAGIDHSAMDHSKMTSSENVDSAPYELQFIDTMTIHHQGAVDMAELAETRAERAELKQLAKAIISDQAAEIAKMKSWRDRFFPGAAMAVNMEMPGMAEGMSGMDMKKLESLKGNDFDLEFIRQMIPHHEGAVLMAKDSIARSAEGKKAANAETAKLAVDFRAFAEGIIAEQDAEITQMQSWQEAWKK